jgi:RNA polymerase sigma-70 factor (ECF subfamily)
MENFNSPDNTRFSVEFLRLFVVHQKSIYTYILALVHNPSEAEDVMQDVVALMWEKFSEFKPGTNFGAWGITVARYKVLEYHHRKKSEYSFFSDRLFDYISQTTAQKLNKMDDQLKALQQCLLKLPESDRKLIQNRYEKGLSIKQVAESTRRSVAGMYKVMGRIHRALIRCVQMTLNAWEMEG